MDFFEEHESVWTRLQRETRPIVLYGMGDGAEKILDAFALYGIRAAAIFASDEFARGNSFRGFRVQKLREVVRQFGENLVIVIAFASQRAEVLAKMDALDAQYDVVAPDVPVVGGTLFTADFVRAHADELRAAYALLADAPSRRVFESTIKYKLTGRLEFLRRCTTDKCEAFETLLRPRADEHFVDLGAYNGDTIRELLSFSGGTYASITALEPDRKNFKKLQAYAAASLGKRVRLLHAGAWEEDGAQTFAAKAGRNSALAQQGVTTQMRAVDGVLHGAPCSLLKLDVEGAEHQALLGARETIARCCPRLNVAAYHRSEDLFALPLLVHELCPRYRIYLRHHPYVPAWDTNLYAAAD